MAEATVYPKSAPRRKPTPEFTWEDLATALLPVLACFLGGATEKWAEGIVIALLGLLLISNPPRFSLGPVFHFVLLALLACAGLAFLPADWFHQPEWRQAMVNDLGIELPKTLSPQPWVTAGCLPSLLAGLCWVYYVAGQEVEIRAARRQLRIFAVGMIFLAGLAVLLHLRGADLPFWHSQRGFGPFPNRNQTANILGLASIIIVACGHDDIRRGKFGWIFWLAGLGVVVTGIVLNFSRAGIALLIIGSLLWLALLILRSGSTTRIAIGAALLLVLLTALLLFGGATLERFHLRGPGAGFASDFRWLIFRDTFQLIRDSPWPGLGLGNFSSVFPIFRNASLAQVVALHPESDWLWLWTEMGWLGVFLVLLGAILLGRRVFPFVEGTNQWFRTAAFIAAVLFVLHSLVDVAGHRVGSAYAGVFLFGLALRRPLPCGAERWLINFFRVIGVLLVFIGANFVVASYRAMPVPGTIGVDIERHLAKATNVGRQFHETIDHANHGLRWAPLDWQLYFLRALGELGAKRPAGEALADFRRARFLAPNSYEVPYQEGLAWMTRQPVLAVTAWREALRRAGPERVPLYARMLSSASQFDPKVKSMLDELGGEEHDLALAYLESARDKDFAAGLSRLLTHDPDLATLTPEERARLFQLWSERGDVATLNAFLAAHPDMRNSGWRAMAKEKARHGDFKGAYELALEFGSRPALPQIPPGTLSIEELQKTSFANPDDYQSAFALFQLQTEQGKTDDALNTARRLAEQPETPPYFHFLEAEGWAAKGNWERAWKAWEAFEGGARP